MPTATDPIPKPRKRSLLVSDFDGTITRDDFYQLAVKRLLPPGVPDHWHAYRERKMTHFEALQAYFAAIRTDEATVMKVVDDMGPDPRLAPCIEALALKGWDVVVTSAGCGWYIDILLGRAGVEVPVYSNPGRFEEGKGLLMSPPPPGPYFSPELGVDKAGVVRQGMLDHDRVAFAGDGFPDLEAARLVADHLRFARGDLAHALAAEGLDFRSFERWSDVADALCEEPS